jgi:hypothetical protein
MFYSVCTKVALFFGLFCVRFVLPGYCCREVKNMLEGKGEGEEDPQGQRQNHMLFIVLWTEWAIALACVHFVTPLHGMADEQESVDPA